MFAGIPAFLLSSCVPTTIRRVIAVLSSYGASCEATRCDAREHDYASFWGERVHGDVAAAFLPPGREGQEGDAREPFASSAGRDRRDPQGVGGRDADERDGRVRDRAVAAGRSCQRGDGDGPPARAREGVGSLTVSGAGSVHG